MTVTGRDILITGNEARQVIAGQELVHRLGIARKHVIRRATPPGKKKPADREGQRASHLSCDDRQDLHRALMALSAYGCSWPSPSMMAFAWSGNARPPFMVCCCELTNMSFACFAESQLLFFEASCSSA